MEMLEIKKDMLTAWIFAWNDILQRYRGSILGPFWITVTIIITAVGLSFVYGAINGMEYKDVLAYIFAGLVGWTLINSMVLESTATFISAAGIIKNIRVPVWFHVSRTLFRILIVTAHNVPALALVLIFCGKFSIIGFFFGTFSLLLTAACLAPLMTVLGMVGARFRDIPQALTSLMQFAMLVTPVFWAPSGSRGIAMRVVTDYNPLYYLLESIRRPFINQGIEWMWMGGLVIFAIITSAISYLITRKFSPRIAFWV